MSQIYFNRETTTCFKISICCLLIYFNYLMCLFLREFSWGFRKILKLTKSALYVRQYLYPHAAPPVTDTLILSLLLTSEDTILNVLKKFHCSLKIHIRQLPNQNFYTLFIVGHQTLYQLLFRVISTSSSTQVE